MYWLNLECAYTAVASLVGLILISVIFFIVFIVSAFHFSIFSVLEMNVNMQYVFHFKSNVFMFWVFIFVEIWIFLFSYYLTFFLHIMISFSKNKTFSLYRAQKINIENRILCHESHIFLLCLALEARKETMSKSEKMHVYEVTSFFFNTVTLFLT